MYIKVGQPKILQYVFGKLFNDWKKKTSSILKVLVLLISNRLFYQNKVSWKDH